MNICPIFSRDMKYLIKIETNVPRDRIRGVDKMMTAIAADYGHKPDNLCLQVSRFFLV